MNMVSQILYKASRGLSVFKYFRGGLIRERGLNERGLNKFLKYEQIFCGDIICIIQESSSITLSSSSVTTISVCRSSEDGRSANGMEPSFELGPLVKFP